MDDLSFLSRIEQLLTEPGSQALASAVARAIRQRLIAEGEKLPTIRVAAHQLGLSPTTVSAAWSILQRAGMIVGNGRNGTRVAEARVGPRRYRDALPEMMGVTDERAAFTMDLSTGTPDPALLPRIESSLALVRLAEETSSYLANTVDPTLEDLCRSTWPFNAERMTITDGAMDAIYLLVTTHLHLGDRVAIEDPNFPPLLDLLDSVGITAVPVALDDEGMQPDELHRVIEYGVQAVIVQPRGQNPTGASMSAERAARLGRLLAGSELIVIEDDSVGDVSNSPDVSIGSMLPNATVHIRSYSVSHGPELRVAAVGGPAGVIDPIIERRFLGQGWTSRLLQQTLAKMLTDAAAVGAVNHAREEYARRRSIVVTELNRFGIPIAGHDGLNIWLPVQDETAALVVLASAGISASPGQPFSMRRESNSHLRVTTARIRGSERYVAALLAQAARTRPQWRSKKP